MEVNFFYGADGTSNVAVSWTIKVACRKITPSSILLLFLEVAEVKCKH
jgi:hypothetical protein